MEGGDEGIDRMVDSKDLQQQSKALDKLTDRVEDRQLNSTRVQEVTLLQLAFGGGKSQVTFSQPVTKLQEKEPKILQALESFFKLPVTELQAMASIAASAEADWNAMRMREKELAAVKINAADVDIIANELELDKKVAEKTLREHKGDAVAAIRHLLR